jgi:hypothetical protein
MDFKAEDWNWRELDEPGSEWGDAAGSSVRILLSSSTY